MNRARVEQLSAQDPSDAHSNLRGAVTSGELYLVCRVLHQLCALPIEQVTETMRPLDVQPLAGVAEPVRGVAIIRGVPVPVVDLARLLSAEASRPTRFVTVSAAGRPVALQVDAVVGIRRIPAASRGGLPPLLRHAGSDAVAAIGSLDAHLLVVLNGVRLVPEAAWDALEAAGLPR